MEFRKGIIYAGLVPVVGGMMWVSITPDASDSVHFWKKKQCESYIRKNFSGEEISPLSAERREKKSEDILMGKTLKHT
jgi:hypothetical protein